MPVVNLARGLTPSRVLTGLRPPAWHRRPFPGVPQPIPDDNSIALAPYREPIARQRNSKDLVFADFYPVLISILFCRSAPHRSDLRRRLKAVPTTTVVR